MLTNELLTAAPGTPEPTGHVIRPTIDQMRSYWRGERLPRFDIGWNRIDFGLLQSNLVLVSGYANHGKGTMVRQIALQMYYKYRTKWAFWSPEDMPEEYFYADIIHMITGKSTEKHHNNYISEPEYLDAFQTATDAIKLIDFETDMPSVRMILEQFDVLYKSGVRGFVLDPFNNTEDANSDQAYDKTIREVGLMMRKWARNKGDVFPIVVTHPKSPTGVKSGEDAKLPSYNELHYGSDWGKIFDDIIIYHHPTFNTNKANFTRIISLAKVKKQKISGKRDDFAMNWNYVVNRILDDEYKCGLPDVKDAPPAKLQPHPMQPIENDKLPF